jgi:GGDEF domain-containing protein
MVIWIALLTSAVAAGLVAWRVVAQRPRSRKPAGTADGAAAGHGDTPPRAVLDLAAPGEPTPRSLTLLAVQVPALSGLGRRLGDGFGLQARAEISQALRAVLRGDDACTPWGEDRFVALVRGVDPDRAGYLRARVHQALSNLTLMTGGGEEIRLEAEVASACVPDQGTSVGELLEAAARELDATRAAALTESGLPAVDPAERLRQAVPLVLN